MKRSAPEEYEFGEQPPAKRAKVASPEETKQSGVVGGVPDELLEDESSEPVSDEFVNQRLYRVPVAGGGGRNLIVEFVPSVQVWVNGEAQFDETTTASIPEDVIALLDPASVAAGDPASEPFWLRVTFPDEETAEAGQKPGDLSEVGLNLDRLVYTPSSKNEYLQSTRGEGPLFYDGDTVRVQVAARFLTRPKTAGAAAVEVARATLVDTEFEFKAQPHKPGRRSRDWSWSATVEDDTGLAITVHEMSQWKHKRGSSLFTERKVGAETFFEPLSPQLLLEREPLNPRLFTLSVLFFPVSDSELMEQAFGLPQDAWEVVLP